MTTKQDNKRQKRSTQQDAKRVKILADSLSGKTTTEIGKELGIGRQAVSKILNSEETKAIITQAESDIKGLIIEAVETLRDTMGVRHDPLLLPNMGNAKDAAKSILKNSGLLKESVEVNHQLPETTIIHLPGGGKLEMGVKKGTEDETD